MFAEYLANLQLQVGVLESPYADSSWYELINAEAYTGRDWRSWHELIHEELEIKKGSSINVEGVTYIVQNPKYTLKKWDLMKSAYLVGYARQIPILIYDISEGITEENEKLILRQANHIFLSTQFDPARVHASQKNVVNYLYEENLFEKVTFLCNHSNAYLERKFSKHLKEAYNDTENLYFFPHIEEIKNALMEGDSAWNHLEQDSLESLNEVFSDMAEHALGKELFEKLQPKKKKRTVLSFFRK